MKIQSNNLKIQRKQNYHQICHSTTQTFIMGVRQHSLKDTVGYLRGAVPDDAYQSRDYFSF